MFWAICLGGLPVLVAAMLELGAIGLLLCFTASALLTIGLWRLLLNVRAKGKHAA